MPGKPSVEADDSDSFCGSRTGSFIWKQGPVLFLTLWQNVFTLNTVEWCVSIYAGAQEKKKEEKKNNNSLQRGTGHNKSVCVRRDQSEPRAQGSIHLCLLQVCGSEWEQLHRNDQDCRGIIILEAGTNNRLRRSKKYCSVLDWACRWDCEPKKNLPAKRNRDGRKSKGSVSRKLHLP